MARPKKHIKKKRAFFLDRDGVLVEDVELLTGVSQLRILPGVVEALRTIERHDYLSVMVTNQTVVARGLINEEQLGLIHESLRNRLKDAGAPPLAAMYVCPHHPHADVTRYRVDCDCRKPKPGMLHRASDDLDIYLRASFMVGDRPSDILAGGRADCTTVLVESGAHRAPPIVGMPDDSPAPDHRFRDLLDATKQLLEKQS